MFKKHLILVLVFSAVFFWSDNLSNAYVAESSNYRLEKDSINFAGTDFSSSTNYSLSDTLGEIASGDSDNLVDYVKAGFRSAGADSSLTISPPDDQSLGPVINGISGGSVGKTVRWTVVTENPGGYAFYVKASAAPALTSGSNYFSDYTPATAGVPDYEWSLASTASEFGFSVTGTDTISLFKNDGSVCNQGENITSQTCWLNFSATDRLIASRNSSTGSAGSTVSLYMKAEVGTAKIQEQGSYSAEITATILAL